MNKRFNDKQVYLKEQRELKIITLFIIINIYTISFNASIFVITVRSHTMFYLLPFHIRCLTIAPESCWLSSCAKSWADRPRQPSPYPNSIDQKRQLLACKRSLLQLLHYRNSQLSPRPKYIEKAHFVTTRCGTRHA